MEIVFILTTVICAIKWLQYRIATLATVYYIEKVQFTRDYTG